MVFRQPELEAREEAPAVAVAAGPASTTVLVVDDEEMVRRLATAALEMRGYRVVVAENGLEAIRKAKANPEVGLVLLDLTMPVMGGEEAIGGIMAALPRAKVILSTGYDSTVAKLRFRHHKEVAMYLQKPYTSRELTEKVAELIGKAK